MRGDDALGVEIVRQLQQDEYENTQFLTIQGDLSRLLDVWINKKVILIDCVQSGSPPGKIFEISSLGHLTRHREILATTHGMSLSQTLDLALQLNKLPAELLFLGIEGKHFVAGQTLSPEVQEAIPEVIRLVQAQIS
jgi:hydrogenase maturation protease